MKAVDAMTNFMTQRCLASILLMMVGAGAGCAASTDEGPGSLEATASQDVIFSGASNQFAGGFSPSNAPDGGFGGGNCVAAHTPVIFVHGNGVDATFFAAPPSTSGALSVYATLKAAGYNDCELFGITWLSPSEQLTPALNFHTSTKAARIRDFINAVKAYTSKSKVNILAHSMGVTVALHGITFGNLWGSIDSFVNVAGGLKGLSSCLAVGFANPASPTCGSQNVFDSNTFGFWPDGAAGASNPRTGTSTSVGFRHEPERRTNVRFFTISGGNADVVVGGDQCKFTSAAALKAQLNVGVDHVSSFTNTGAIMNTMLNSSCTGTGCCAGFSGPCSNL